MVNRTWSKEEQDKLLMTLKNRFELNRNRHPGMEWEQVRARLDNYPEKLRSLQHMEMSGGEPDVVGVHPSGGEILFFDCSAESPAGRRNLCYDHVFVYHNGAGSSYAVRGFRTLLKV